MKRGKRFVALIVLALTGFVSSLYLLFEHYSTSGSVCDFGATVSCSLVNSSVFSELLGVPIALFGALWFVFLLGFIAMGRTDNYYLRIIYWWHLFGLISVLYLVIAEIILGAICPVCTIVHAVIVVGAMLSYKLQQGIKLKSKTLKKRIVPWLLVFGVISTILLITFNVSGQQADHSTLAQCLTDKGVNMYGSFRCGVCAKTRAMFGDAFALINEIECHPQGENAQTDLCLAKEIGGTPTWILEPEGVEVKRQLGFMSTEELAVWAGCGIDAS